jgi:hypothetical protein
MERTVSVAVLIIDSEGNFSLLALVLVAQGDVC